ncbi:FMN-binding negative transcriptional regulator [Rhodoferax mekongensis]|uniref:FMN-binding negative transcriptional regulator n=1 Tax=Rhodoferax mekongensis TaxID=3068341 RepID=UPI0028BE1693|nr:FMN-binding negative transcriptional regulator [Rhodoferax sp. TBRC 17199]MDT7516562.1 FMN-binding negative transcriptional regulator [Rhodoferax sp. TBRC 17199]
MYQPSHFIENRPEVLHALVQSHPLATLVTLSDKGLDANHIPLLLRVAADGRTSLVGHVARANPIWKDADLSVPVLAIFQGPQHYISPGWYATKAEHGKVVPTWNYAVVHAKGLLTVHDDAAWIRSQMQQITTQQEAPMNKPWAVDDAPRDYTDKMISAVVGIEIVVDEWVGKWKVSQNQPPANQTTVREGLEHQATDAARTMAGLIPRS